MNLTEHDRREKGGQRAAGSTALNTPKSTTILFSIRLDGGMPTTSQRGRNEDTFLNCLRDILLPTST